AFFMVGALCYRAYERIKTADLPRAVTLGAWAAVVISIVFYDQIYPAWGEWVLFPMFAVALPLVFSLTRSWNLDRVIGEFSYPVYLAHPIVIGAIRRFTPNPWLGDAAAVLTILLAVVLIKYVAQPIEAYRERRVATTHVPATV